MRLPALVTQNLTCEYHRWGQRVLALDGLNLIVPQGQWLMIAGPNGAGKSTLLRVIAGQVRDYTGDVCIGQHPLRKMSERERANSVYYVNQDPTLGSAPMLTVFENLLIADPKAAGKSRRNMGACYRELLAEAGLQSRLHHPAHYLSGGERQLLAFLIARLRPVSLVLLDEVLAAMDASRTAICLRLLEELQKDGKTLLFVTHSLGIAQNYGDRTVVLAKGRLAYDASGSERSDEHIRAIINQELREGVLVTP
jgi:putative ABC transport system ATP-binding protein